MRWIVDENDSMRALSTLGATRLIEPRRPADRGRMPKIQDLYYVAQSAWTTVPAGLRFHGASSRASSTRSEGKWSDLDQPTTIRLQASTTAQQ